MKIKNGKYLIRGILFILLGAAIAAVRFIIFSSHVHGLLKPILAIGACLFIGIVHVILAFLNDEKDQTEEKE